MAGASVAIVHYTAPPVVGGVELLVAVHAGLFADRGYPTSIVAGMGESFRSDIPVRIIPSLYTQTPKMAAIAAELDQGVVSDRFHEAVEDIYHELMAVLVGTDVALVHNAFTMHFNLPLTAALHRMADSGRGPHMVAWCHDLAWSNDLYAPRMRDEFPWSLLRKPLKGVEYVVVSRNRQAEMAQLTGLPEEKLRVVPAGVDPAVQLKLEPETLDLTRRLGLLDGDLLMLAPVRISRRKNLELSLRILRALKDQGVRARFVVTGPPGPLAAESVDYVEALRRLRAELGLEGDALFLFEHGPSPEEALHVTDRVMYDLYSLSDILLFSSAQEGFGIPIIEAGLSRLPVFCTDIPPFREIGSCCINCFGLEEDPAEVARRIRRWMEEDSGYKLRRRVLSNYTMDSVFKELIEPLAVER